MGACLETQLAMKMDRAPRVLFFTHSLSDVDGVGRVACSILRHLVPECDRAELFIGRGHRGFSESMPNDERLTVFPTLATGHFPFMPLTRLLWVLLLGLPEMIRAARRADIVHSLADYPMGLLAVIAARVARRPVLIWGHGTYSVTPWSQPVHCRLIAWMFRRANLFTVGSHYALDRLREVADPGPIEVVPYGVEPDAFAEDKTQGEEPEVPTPFLLCIGEVKERKGYGTSLPAFLEAWSRRPDIHFVIVGRYSDADPYFRSLKEDVVAAGATEHVHFLGHVSEGRKVALLRSCQAFVLTSMTSREGAFEAFGLVYLEAGAAGRPVIGVQDSGAEDAIVDGENGFLLDRDDPGGVAGAIERLFEDRDLADRMGQAGLHLAQGRTWADAASQIGEIYTSLLETDRGAR